MDRGKRNDGKAGRQHVRIRGGKDGEKELPYVQAA